MAGIPPDCGQAEIQAFCQMAFLSDSYAQTPVLSTGTRLMDGVIVAGGVCVDMIPVRLCLRISCKSCAENCFIFFGFFMVFIVF